MTHGADTLDLVVAIELRTTGIAVDLQIGTNSHSACAVAILLGRGKVVGVGPDGI